MSLYLSQNIPDNARATGRQWFASRVGEVEPCFEPDFAQSGRVKGGREGSVRDAAGLLGGQSASPARTSGALSLEPGEPAPESGAISQPQMAPAGPLADRERFGDRPELTSPD